MASTSPQSIYLKPSEQFKALPLYHGNGKRKEPLVYVVKDVARILHTSPASVLHFIRTGQLVAIRLPGNHLRITSQALEDFILNHVIQKKNT